MAKPIFVVNGPNLNLLGVREPHLYGSETLAQLEDRCRTAAAAHGFEIDFFQSNAEFAIVDKLQEARLNACAVVINPAAFCYYSVAIIDALRMVETPIIEVHLTHIHGRSPEWRSKTITAAACNAMISGLGTHGYVAAIDYIAKIVEA